MPDDTAVDRLYQEAKAVLEALTRTPEISLQVAAGDNLRKALLLAAASHFEQRLCNCVLDFVKHHSDGSSLLEQFVRNKAISYRYHTWFEWGSRNANGFYNAFGTEFQKLMKDREKNSDELRRGVKAFLEISNERNRLVHQDYATFPMDKTLDEIYSLYQRASVFVDQLQIALRDCDGSFILNPFLSAKPPV